MKAVGRAAAIKTLYGELNGSKCTACNSLTSSANSEFKQYMVSLYSLQECTKTCLGAWGAVQKCGGCRSVSAKPGGAHAVRYHVIFRSAPFLGLQHVILQPQLDSITSMHLVTVLHQYCVHTLALLATSATTMSLAFLPVRNCACKTVHPRQQSD